MLSINNIDIEPRWEQFKNPNSTNFSKYSEWWNITNATLFKPKIGKIEFPGRTVNFDDADLDTYINFTHKEFSLSENHLYCLHGKIRLTFFNITYYAPTLYYYDQDCIYKTQECNLIEYNNKTHEYVVEIYKPGKYIVKETAIGVISNFYDSGDIYGKIIYGKNVSFYVNYTVLGQPLHKPHVHCDLYITKKGSDNVILNKRMIYNNNSKLYEYSFNTTLLNDIGDFIATAKCDATYYDLGMDIESEEFKVSIWSLNSYFWTSTQPRFSDIPKDYNQTLDELLTLYHAKTIYNDMTPSIYISLIKNDQGTLSPVTDSYTCNISFGDGTNLTNLKLNTKELVEAEIEGQNEKVVIIRHKYQWPGEYNISIFCWYDELSPYAQGSTNMKITNRLPVLVHEIPDATWLQDQVYSPYKLNDYFYDPDGETLTYSYSNIDSIQIIIGNDSTVTYVPYSGFYGSRIVFFFASDRFGYVTSNPVNLTVIKRRIELSSQQPMAESRKVEEQEEVILCEEKWNCTPWGKCMPSGIQIRRCFDLNHCNTTFKKPPEYRHCLYTPTCYDGIRNQGEEGIDCGGPCPPCPTCYDGIQNQGEEGIDCGGPCPPCPTCYDGIQNQGEEGIDCGGPCPPCKYIERPSVVKTFLINHMNEVIISSFTIFALIIIGLQLLPYAHRLNTLLINVLNALITLFKIPSFEEVRIYQPLINRIKEIKARSKRIKIEKGIDYCFRIFHDLISNLLELKREYTLEELRKIVINSNLEKREKLLLLALIKKFEVIRYTGRMKIRRRDLYNLINQVEFAVKKSKYHLEEIELKKEIENLKNTLSKREFKIKAKIIERRNILTVLRQLHELEKNINNKELKEAIKRYKLIKSIYNNLNWVNRLKLKSRILDRYHRIKNLIEDIKNERNKK